jgi:hypothetical protein
VDHRRPTQDGGTGALREADSIGHEFGDEKLRGVGLLVGHEPRDDDPREPAGDRHQVAIAGDLQPSRPGHPDPRRGARAGLDAHRPAPGRHDAGRHDLGLHQPGRHHSGPHHPELWEPYKRNLPRDYTTFIGLEAEASEFQEFEPLILPGLLQTGE